MLSIFTVKTIAAVFDFYNSGKLGRERNLYQGGCRRSKIRRGVGVGEDKMPALQANMLLCNSVGGDTPS